MLGKLIKHEFKSTKSTLLLFAALLGVAAVIALMLGVNIAAKGGDVAAEDSGVISGASAMIMTLAVLAFAFLNAFTFTAVFIGAINRFRTNLLGNEGYLMHALPVTPAHHIAAKLIPAIVWTLLGIIAALVSYAVIILGLIPGINAPISELWDRVIYLFQNAGEELVFPGVQIALAAVELFISAVIGLANIYLHIYASMAVGYSLKNHRAAASIGVFILLSIASGMLDSVIFVPLSDALNSASVLLNLETLYSAVCAAGFYIIAAWFLDKRLNLQ